LLLVPEYCIFLEHLVREQQQQFQEGQFHAGRLNSGSNNNNTFSHSSYSVDNFRALLKGHIDIIEYLNSDAATTAENGEHVYFLHWLVQTILDLLIMYLE
ncbi:hypothetical protein T01_5652, partial [Trichinella spiralis]